MYLLITEDCQVYKVDEITADDLEAVSDGLMDIIDISKMANPMIYFDGKWIPVEELD